MRRGRRSLLMLLQNILGLDRNVSGTDYWVIMLNNPIVTEMVYRPTVYMYDHR